MRNIKYSLFKISIIALLLFSCEDVLIENPPSALSAESFYQSEEDAIAGLYGAYANIYSIYDVNSIYLGDLIADDLTISPIVSDLLGIEELTFTNEFGSIWATSYSAINRVNVVISSIENIAFDANRKADLIAEAKALRALYYWNLVRFIGDVPLYENAGFTNEELLAPRTPAEDVYAVVIRDLTDAVNELSDSNEPGRINSNIANALLARIYLYRGDYANALTHAKNVIDSGNYDLFSDYADVFKSDNNNGIEHIFQLQFVLGERHTTVPARFGIREIASNRRTYWSSNFAIASLAPSATFVSENPESYRKSVTVSDRYDHIDGVSGTILMTDHYADFPYYINKYDHHRPQQIQSDMNFNIIRYADVLLIAAEASNEVNPGDDVKYTWINKVRKRARTDASGIETPTDLPDLSGLNQDDFRTAVLEERRFELAFEGIRAWDLKRRGEFLIKVRAQGITIEDYKVLFPVPDAQIKLNSNLTQNPGWE